MRPRFRVAIAAAGIVVALAACTTAGIVASLVPDGTTATLLGNLEKVTDVNRKRVAAMAQGGRWDELATFAEENLRKDARNADWWMILGYARSQQGALQAATKAFSEVVSIEPDNEVGWNLLAQSHRSAGDSRRAIIVLNNALLALREPSVTLYLLGECYTDIGRDVDARAAYEKSLSIEPQFAEAWFGLTRTYERLGLRNEAREARVRLEKLAPQLAKRLDATPSPGGAAAR